MTPVAKKVLADYRVGKTVGEGAFSKVKLGYHRITGEKVAVKIISKRRLELSYKKKEREKKEREKRAEKRKQEREKKEAELIRQGKMQPKPPPEPPKELTEEEKKQKAIEEERQREKDEELQEHLPGRLSKSLSREVRLLQVLRHPNIIRLYQVIETEQEFYIITEFAGGGEIIDHIAKNEHLDEVEARRFFREIVSAVDHCHLCGVLHRDLKLENILLSAEKHVLISDFGLGRSYQMDNLCATFCGTPLYAAPELVSGIKYFGPPADIWAMGVVLYAMVCGKPPFQADTMSELYKKIKNVEYKFPQWCSPEFQDLIQKIFVKDPSQRLTMDGIRTHEWVVKGYGEAPFRLEPTQPVKQYNSTDSQVDNARAIQYDDHSMLYSFNDPNPSRDITRPKVPMASSRSSGDYRIDMDVGNRRMVIPHVRVDSVLDREEVKRANVTVDVVPSLSDLHVSVQKLNGHLDPATMPTAPHRAALTRREGSNREMDDLTSSIVKVTKFRRSASQNTPLPSLPMAPVPSTVQPTKPPQVMRRPLCAANPLRPGRSSLPDPNSLADLAAAAGAVGYQAPARRRASFAALAREQKGDGTLGSPSRRSLGDSPSGGELKSVKGTFNLPATTSKFTPDELVAEVLRVLTMLNIYFVQTDRYTVTCIHNSSYERVEIEIEVVKVWLLNMVGVRLKRVAGSTWLYKQIYTKIVGSLQVQ
eukprot:comp24155_c1_seq1/m.43995 comp24155_c1_seq1/g.43995  ORF comp24155_c1_seq1/g.43995 comp24155_c1_seq1/m.43995 type:complete len:704 (-) comp24155_c1_seq1:186-2297(-)